MERPRPLNTMPLRWKEPKPGDRVRVRNCQIYFYLPPGLPDQTDCILIRRETGTYIVEAFGRQWEIPIQCLVHEQERQLNGVWLDAHDRRVRKAQALIDRLHEQEQRRKAGESRVLAPRTAVYPAATPMAGVSPQRTPAGSR